MSDSVFWTFFGSVWLIVGLGAAALSGFGLATGFLAPPGGPDLRWVFLAGGIATTGAGLWIVVGARRAAARVRRLMADGIEIAATVTELRPSAIAVNRRRLWRVHYRYDHGAGGPFAGASDAMRQEMLAGLAPGSAVRIKIDPAQPARSVFLAPA